MPTRTKGADRDGQVPAVLGARYEVEVEIGAGAFATTYRGHDRRLDRTVAIKILSQEYARDPTYAQRFEREAQTAASISHGNVVDVYDFGQQDDVLYIVMQYIAGEDLKHLITREGAIPADRARAIAIEVLSGLAAIHKAGITHRDIKPQNILIGTDGSARVADFGIAQIDVDSGLTTAGMTVGTAAYMAPEQAEGGRTTAATDLYAVGVVLYEMLTGILPFDAPTTMALMLAHIQQQPVPPSQRANGRPIPPDLDAIVMQALAKAPGERFRSAAAMTQALRGASVGGSAQQPTVALPASRAQPARHSATAEGSPRRPRTDGATVPPRMPPPTSRAPASEGGGFASFLSKLLLIVLAGLIIAVGYVWWDARDNNAGVGSAETPTVTVAAPTPTAESTEQVILPAEPAPTDEPTALPTTELPVPTATTAPPTPEPTREPPTEEIPTIGPSSDGNGSQVIEPAATQP